MNYTLDARTATSHFPGIGRYVRNLSKILPELLTEEESLQLIYTPDGSEWLQELPPNKNIKPISLPISPFDIAQQWIIPGLLKRIDVDLYHSPYYLMPYRVPVPPILTVYDLIPLLYPQYSSSRARLIFRFSMSLALRSSQRTIAISHSTKDDYLKYFSIPKNSISVIPLGVEDRFHPQADSEILRIRSKYHLPKKYALYLGSNKPHKNLSTLVEAWSRIISNNSLDKYKLIVAGSWYENHTEIKNQVAGFGLNDAILFQGQLPDEDLPGLYSGAHLFMFPSLYEGFGLPVLEAMACGTPVACSDIPSLHETCGEAALFFDPWDIKDISEAILTLWNNKSIQHSLVSRGLEQAANFTWEKTAENTIKLYRETLRER